MIEDPGWLAEAVFTQLTDRVPVDERERVSLDRIFAEWDLLDSPFSEESGPIHFTGSALVIGPRGVLLHKHRRLGIWLQPGGHIDADETPWDAALRETAEETGLESEFAEVDSQGSPVLAHVDVHEGGRGHTHLDLRYVLDAGTADPNPPQGESQEVRWFSWGEALDIADDGLRGILVARFPDLDAQNQ